MNSPALEIDLFISHSSLDSDLAEKLIDLLQTACTLSPSRIRCTSVDGYRLPAGASTDAQLRQEVRLATAFVGIITSDSIESAYVLFELGARWGASLPLIPLLAKGADAKYLRGPLGGLNALDCSVPAQIHQLINDVAGQLNLSVNQPAVYQRHLEVVAKIGAAVKP